MAERQKKLTLQAVWIIPILAMAIIIVLAVIWRITASPKNIAGEPRESKTVNVKPPIIKSSQNGQITINDIINVRKHWNPAFSDWIGKQAPDFEISDLDGKAQKISTYKGRTVMLVFWATWCPPCRAEIPNLIEMRKQISADKLAIIAIAFEPAENLRSFAQKNEINYIVIPGNPGSLPGPYNFIDSIPTTFFIDKTGVIRLVSQGLVLPNETDLILKAIEI